MTNTEIIKEFVELMGTWHELDMGFHIEYFDGDVILGNKYGCVDNIPPDLFLPYFIDKAIKEIMENHAMFVRYIKNQIGVTIYIYKGCDAVKNIEAKTYEQAILYAYQYYSEVERVKL